MCDRYYGIADKCEPSHPIDNRWFFFCTALMPPGLLSIPDSQWSEGSPREGCIRELGGDPLQNRFFLFPVSIEVSCFYVPREPEHS